MSYRYDSRSGRYRDERGRFLPAKAVRDAVDNLTDVASNRAAGLARQLAAGGRIADFQQGMMQLARNAHVAAGVAAHGGRDQMSPADWGTIGRRLRDQYGYLRQFADDVASGRQPLDGRLEARARQYGQAARPTFEAIRARDDRNRGMTVERNVLHPADHCKECPTLTARGWVPIGSLPPIGARACRVHDRCTVERRLAAP